MCAPKDFAGSMMKWAMAINRHTSYAARLLTFTTHELGYAVDLVVPELDSQRHGPALTLAEEANVLHLKDEFELFLDRGKGDRNAILRRIFDTERMRSKATVFTHSGGFAREMQADKSYQDHVLRFDARIAMTPDLNFPWFDGDYIPHAIDTVQFPYCWSDCNHLVHSPSSMIKKGTKEFCQAVATLPAFSEWTLDVIQGVTHAECLERKKRASLFFDQAGRQFAMTKSGKDEVIGWYGNSALEAMVHGIPTIAHLSENAFAGAARAGKSIRETCPVLNTPCLDVEGMRATLQSFLDISSEERRALSVRTRDWIEQFHSYPAVAADLAMVYDRLLGYATASDQDGQGCQAAQRT